MSRWPDTDRPFIAARRFSGLALALIHSYFAIVVVVVVRFRTVRYGYRATPNRLWVIRVQLIDRASKRLITKKQTLRRPTITAPI